MADTIPKTAEDIEKELTVGKFSMQQARTLAFQIGGIFVGWIAGKSVGKTSLRHTVGKWAQENMHLKDAHFATDYAGKTLIPLIGAMLGSTVGGIASLYERWVKVERERLSVQEINKDVASVMQSRVQFEDMLDKQHAIVQSLLEERKQAPETMQGKLDAQRNQAATAELGHA